jgi:glycosyltransferase involved in cell wall biosynthesis
MIRLAVFATHPIQYFVPLWRELSRRPGLEVTVFYFSDHSVRGGLDRGFQMKLAWDVPLLTGYRHVFISRNADLSKPGSVDLPDARRILIEGNFNAVLLLGYTHAFEREVARASRSLDIKIVLRGDFSSHLRTAWWKLPLKRIYLKWFYELVDVFGYAGESGRRHLAENGVSESRMVYIPWAVDTTLFEAQKRRFSRSRARRRLGYREKDVVALFCGKLDHVKQPLLFLDALARLPEVKGLIVGSGPLMATCAQRVSTGLGDRVLLRGFVNQSELGLHYRASDFLVLPSISETWGLVVNEAMQFGLPAIVSDGVGCRLDLVKPGRTGYVFPVGNADALVKAIGLLVRDRPGMRQMGRAAASWIRPFTVSATADGLVKALDMALSRSPDARD